MCLENVTGIFVTNLVNVGKKLETKLQYFDIYLHNKNILEYALLLVHSGRFMIFHIEGSSIIQVHRNVVKCLHHSHGKIE